MARAGARNIHKIPLQNDSYLARAATPLADRAAPRGDSPIPQASAWRGALPRDSGAFTRATLTIVLRTKKA